MVLGVFVALVGAGFANLGAKCHKVAGKFRAASVEPSAQGADVGAVAAELHAVRHIVVPAVLIAHVEAGRYAAFAGLGASKAGIGVLMVVLHRLHGC